MFAIYEFYPTLANGLAPTMDARELSGGVAAEDHAQALLAEHVSAESVVIIVEGRMFATVKRTGVAAAGLSLA